MGRNRKKSIGAVTYDIFGNVIGETPDAATPNTENTDVFSGPLAPYLTRSVQDFQQYVTPTVAKILQENINSDHSIGIWRDPTTNTRYLRLSNAAEQIEMIWSPDNPWQIGVYQIDRTTGQRDVTPITIKTGSLEDAVNAYFNYRPTSFFVGGRTPNIRQQTVQPFRVPAASVFKQEWKEFNQPYSLPGTNLRYPNIQISNRLPNKALVSIRPEFNPNTRGFESPISTNRFTFQVTLPKDRYGRQRTYTATVEDAGAWDGQKWNTDRLKGLAENLTQQWMSSGEITNGIL